jgi:hypothetical protein
MQRIEDYSMITSPWKTRAEPLINWPFCPDNAILDGFSGSFARYLLSAISWHYHSGIVRLTL